MAIKSTSRSRVGRLAASTLAALAGPGGRPGVLAAALGAAIVVHAVLLALFTAWPVSDRPANPLAAALGRQVSSTAPDTTESQLAGEVRTGLTAPALTDDRPLTVQKAPRLAAVAPKRPSVDIPLAVPQPTPRDVPPARTPEPVITLTNPLRPPPSPAATEPAPAAPTPSAPPTN